MADDPARSAIVRATLILRWYPRGDSLSDCAAEIRVFSAASVSAECDSMSRARMSALVERPDDARNRVCCVARAAAMRSRAALL